MSKSKKRLLIRLSVISAIVALGIFAVIQSKGIFGEDQSEQSTNTNDHDKNADEKNNDNQDGDNQEKSKSAGGANGSDSFDGNGGANFNSSDSFVPPVQPSAFAQKTIVRGNDSNEFKQLKTTPVGSTITDDPAARNNLPPDNRSFDFKENFSPAPQLPPSQPPIEGFVQNDVPNIPGNLAPVTSNPAPLSPLPGREDSPNVTPVESTRPSFKTGAANGENDDSRNRIPDFDNGPPANSQFAPRNQSTTPIVPRSSYPSDMNRAPVDISGLQDQSTGNRGYSDPPVDEDEQLASARPGPKQLEGAQAPSLTLQKKAPAEIQVGKPAMFQLAVKNVGRVDADNVAVIDRIPNGTRFVDASPEATRMSDGSLVWNLGTLKPGGEATVSVQLIPLVEGEIGSVATVAFQSKASVSTICTKPVLKVEHSGPSEVLIGQSASFDIKVTNTGTGVATNVILEEDVPPELSHPAGGELEYEIGDLRPGESRQIRLTLQAKKAGRIENVLLVRGEGNLLAEHRAPVEVIAPDLAVTMKGPSRRYLERQATYTVSVENPGTAKATDIELVAFLPKGLKFVETNNQGQYDPQTHAVYWSLTELPAKESGEVELKALPVEMGQQKLRVESRAGLGLSASHEQFVVVDGLAAIFFGVVDTEDPIEVGKDTVYEVQVVNQGSKTATDVRVFAKLPDGLRPIGGDGPTTYRIRDQTIEFVPLARLAPKGKQTYKIQARGVQEGDQRITVQVDTNEVRDPVSKEESTKVYVDQ